jgi:hypothetical protein
MTKLIAGKPDHCPNCGRHDIRPSWLRGWPDTWRRYFALAPYRCRACEYRFYRKMTKVEVEQAEALPTGER